MLDAGLEVLLAEGYAGLTYGKVATRSGENKSLISYYFGSKQGLVSAVAELVGDRITTEVLRHIADAATVRDLAGGLVDGLWRVMDDDPRLARLYFDLSAVSVVEAEVSIALGEVKARWRGVIGSYLAGAGVPDDSIEGAATFLLAGVQGLAIERLELVESERLESARSLFVDAAGRAIEPIRPS